MAQFIIQSQEKGDEVKGYLLEQVDTYVCGMDCICLSLPPTAKCCLRWILTREGQQLYEIRQAHTSLTAHGSGPGATVGYEWTISRHCKKRPN